MIRKMSALILALVFAQGVIAAGGSVNLTTEEKARQVVSSHFREAVILSSSRVGNVYVVEFRVESEKRTAYVNENGDILGTARHIPVNMLPLGLQLDIQRRFYQAQVYDIVENSVVGQYTEYLMQIEKDGITFVVTGDPQHILSVRKSRKK